MKRLLLIFALILALCVGTGLPYGLTAEAADLGTYSWTGEWETNWGDMVLTQTGSKVSGTYTHDQGKISGTVSGNILTGTWSESPSYAPPNDAGDVEFVMSEDGKSFTGKWRYGSEGSWGRWDGGTRATEVILTTPAKEYGNASSWAVSELDKAAEYGLIPVSLKGADMTKPITREEFAELGVKLYEQTTGTSAASASPNPFTDTNNREILKAFKLGITTGTSSTTFSPKVLINREQCAAMLFRTIKAIHPGGNYSIAGIPDFPDQNSISSYAVEATKYMSKLGIVKGDAKGYFMPKATTSAQTAAGYGMATREAAVLMSVRTYDKVDEIKESKATAVPEATTPATPTAPETPAQPQNSSGSIVGTWQTGSITGHTYSIITGDFRFNAGLGQLYVFKSDGTFSTLIVAGYGNSISINGNYAVKDGKLTFSGQTSKKSSDFGQTWTPGNSPADSTRYYSIGTGDDGPELLMGLEGATPPLDIETNAVSYSFMQ